MNKRRLGKTNLMVSEVSLGGIPLQRLDKEKAREVVEKSLDLGINFIDTARAYSVSEELIGDALSGRRDEVYLATKTMSRGYEAAKSDIETSLRNLKTDYIDLYQIHLVKDMDDYKAAMGIDGVYRALLEAKRDGKIGHIGITAHSADLLGEIMDPKYFDTIQFPYNAVERQGEDLFRRANEMDMGVIIMKPIAGGAIENGEASIKWILENENISVVIPGMATEDEVVKNIAAANGTLSDEERKYIDMLVNELGSDFCRRCGYCLPCPEGLNIPALILFEGYVKRYNLRDWSEARYRALDIKASACIECGICETKCPYHLKIREKLRSVAETFGE